MSTRKSIEKQRMRFAYEFVKNNISGESNAKKFEAYVQKVPAFIMTNGLGNTLAYLSTQRDDQWQHVQNAVCKWLSTVNNPLKNRIEGTETGIDEVLKCLKEENFTDREYRTVTIETLAMFNWLRRFAKAHRQNLKAANHNNNG